MRLLKCGLWLLAWSVWFILGVGLYRELPRELGPVVRVLPFQPSERPMGFLPDGKSVATMQHAGRNEPTTIFVYDVETGGRIRTIPGPSFEEYLRTDEVFTGMNRGGDVRWHGVILSKVRPATATRSAVKGLYLLNLADGGWRVLAKEEVNFAVFHDSRPWVLFKERMPDNVPNRRVVVVDYETGEQLFEQRPTKGDGLVGHPFFIPGTDQLVLPMKTTAALLHPSEPGRFEIWTIGGVPTLQVVQSVMSDATAHYSPSPSGLVAVTGGMMQDHSVVDVVDVNTGLMRGSFPPMSERSRDDRRLGFGRGFVSRNGRTVMRWHPTSTTLWDVETKERLWTIKAKGIVPIHPDENRFIENEVWSQLVESWIGKKPWLRELNSSAWRNLETGRMEFRTWMKSHPKPEWTTLDGSLSIGPDGAIHRMPYRLNWPLLALCQTILALPLVLLWALLRWRKRRAARLL
jgi:hypothetical protein